MYSKLSYHIHHHAVPLVTDRENETNGILNYFIMKILPRRWKLRKSTRIRHEVVELCNCAPLFHVQFLVNELSPLSRICIFSSPCILIKPRQMSAFTTNIHIFHFPNLSRFRQVKDIYIYIKELPYSPSRFRSINSIKVPREYPRIPCDFFSVYDIETFAAEWLYVIASSNTYTYTKFAYMQAWWIINRERLFY